MNNKKDSGQAGMTGYGRLFSVIINEAGSLVYFPYPLFVIPRLDQGIQVLIK
jgi:hypothetical protein